MPIFAGADFRFAPVDIFFFLETPHRMLVMTIKINTKRRDILTIGGIGLCWFTYSNRGKA
jgi:hypothetical protein